MSRWGSLRWANIGYAAATGAGVGSFLFWAGYWITFVRGSLQGPDFFSFYSGAKLYVVKGGSAVYDLALQKQYELQVIPHPAAQFVVLPYFPSRRLTPPGRADGSDGPESSAGSRWPSHSCSCWFRCCSWRAVRGGHSLVLRR